MPPLAAIFLCCCVFPPVGVWGIKFNPCSEPELAKRGGEFVIGLAYWPGATIEDWGSKTDGIQPCSGGTELAERGLHFGTFRTRVDRLTSLKTSFPEILYLTSKGNASVPVITVVAFR